GTPSVPHRKSLADETWMLSFVNGRDRKIGDIDRVATLRVPHELGRRYAVFAGAVWLRWRTHLPSLDVQRRCEHRPADVACPIGLQSNQMSEDDAVHGTAGRKVHVREHRIPRFVHRRSASDLDHVRTDGYPCVGCDG